MLSLEAVDEVGDFDGRTTVFRGGRSLSCFVGQSDQPSECLGAEVDREAKLMASPTTCCDLHSDEKVVKHVMLW